MRGMADDSETEKRGAQLYAAVVQLLNDHSSMGLLVAVGDAKDKISWDKAHTKTRELFRHLAVNLTETPPASRLGS
jgi:hypothetical protein